MNKMLEKTMKELNASLNKQEVIIHNGHEQFQFVAEVIPSPEVVNKRRKEKFQAIAKNTWTVFYQSTIMSVGIIAIIVAIVPPCHDAFEKMLGF